jgi:hypothetical protein
MSQPQAVLTHLLEGREELAREVLRLTTAINELDAVIARVRGTAAPVAATSATPGRPARPASAPRAGSAGPSGRHSTSGRTGAGAGGGGKSIRVQVLEILADDDRSFAMTEIIDRIHDAGTTAHDDAVRSITTKLMKDGQVERVGRGQYRLTRVAAAAPVAPATANGSGPSTAMGEAAAAGVPAG